MLLLLFLSGRGENEASRNRLSSTLTSDILLQSDNLLHTSPKLMVPLTITGLRSDWISVETLLHMNMFTLVFFIVIYDNKYSSVYFLTIEASLRQVMGLLENGPMLCSFRFIQMTPKPCSRMALQWGCTTLQFVRPSSISAIRWSYVTPVYPSIHGQPTQLSSGERWVTPWISHQLIIEPTDREKHPFILTFTPEVSVESPVHLSPKCLWTVGGSWSTRRELMQTWGEWKLYTGKPLTPGRI